jgi:hypothetical protein
MTLVHGTGGGNASALVSCRSGYAWESIKVFVDIGTKVEALHYVAEEVVATIKLHPKWFGGDYRVWFTDTGPNYKLQISVIYNNSNNGTDVITVRLARTYMIAALTRGLEAAGVSFTLPPMRDGSSGAGDAACAVQHIAAHDSDDDDGDGAPGQGQGDKKESGEKKASAAAANVLVIA